LSEASSFCSAETISGIAPKVQPAVFLFCYLFSFCCQKEKSKGIVKKKKVKAFNLKKYAYLCRKDKTYE